MDTRQLVEGTTLYLPVEVEGALFSWGEAHAAQGDGEVCVTGIEAPMHGELCFTLQKGRRIPVPQYQTAGPLTPRVDAGGSYGTTGVGPDLYAAAQEAVRAMIDYLAEEYGLSPEDAYVLPASPSICGSRRWSTRGSTSSARFFRSPLSRQEPVETSSPAVHHRVDAAVRRTEEPHGRARGQRRSSRRRPSCPTSSRC
jgi:hypothetical protein